MTKIRIIVSLIINVHYKFIVVEKLKRIFNKNMHRSKSSLSLRNLANSLKHSIELDQHKTHKK